MLAHGQLIPNLLDPVFLSAATTLFVVVLIGVLVLSALLACAACLAIRRLIKRRALNHDAESASSLVPACVKDILGRPIPYGRRSQFLDGVRATADGFRFMNAYPWKKTWRYAITPAICNLVVTAVAIAGFLAVVISVVEPIHSSFGDDTFSRLLETFTFILVTLVTAALVFALWLLTQSIVCGHFFSKLALQTEELLGTHDGLCGQSLLQESTDTAKDIGSLIAVQLALLVVNIVPGLGTIIASIGGLYFGARFAGSEFQSYPLTARSVPRTKRKDFAKRHHWNVLGLGAATFVSALIPGVGALLLSTSVVGGVLQFHRLRAHEKYMD